MQSVYSVRANMDTSRAYARVRRNSNRMHRKNRLSIPRALASDSGRRGLDFINSFNCKVRLNDVKIEFANKKNWIKF